EVFQRALVVPLVRVGVSEAEVAFGEAAPVASAAVVVERLVRVVARDGVLADRTVDAGERGVDVAELRVGAAALRGRAQLRVEYGDGLRVVARIVVGEAEARAHAGQRLGFRRARRVCGLVHLHGFERG